LVNQQLSGRQIDRRNPRGEVNRIAASCGGNRLTQRASGSRTSSTGVRAAVYSERRGLGATRAEKKSADNQGEKQDAAPHFAIMPRTWVYGRSALLVSENISPSFAPARAL